jgi:hypothetical protein
MDTVLRQAGLARAGDVPVTRAPPLGARGVTRAFGRLLLTMAQTPAQRVILPQRDPPPPEWFRFPLP